MSSDTNQLNTMVNTYFENLPRIRTWILRCWRRMPSSSNQIHQHSLKTRVAFQIKRITRAHSPLKQRHNSNTARTHRRVPMRRARVFETGVRTSTSHEQRDPGIPQRIKRHLYQLTCLCRQVNGTAEIHHYLVSTL